MNENAKRIFNVVLKVVTWALIAFTVFMVVFTVFTVLTVDKNERSVFGIRFYIVKTDSMSESEENADLDVHFNAGDIILIKNVEDKTALDSGDIIAFLSANSESYGETITHMIRERRESQNGKLLGYVTYGTNTGTNDEALVEPDYIIGEYAGKLPGVGNFFAFVKSTPGYIICILIPFLLLILYNGVNFVRLFRQYRKEQNAEIEAERAEIAEERRQNAEMLRELQELKAQLNRQNAATAATPSSEEDTTASDSSEG